MTEYEPHPRWQREAYFWIGIIATLAYRLIIILNSFSAIWVQVAWYIGTVGFVLFFFHRYQVDNRRAHIVANHQLAKKVAKSDLSAQDKEALDYLLRTTKSSKAKINYIVIFAASAVALVIGVYLDFFNQS